MLSRIVVNRQQTVQQKSSLAEPSPKVPFGGAERAAKGGKANYFFTASSDAILPSRI
jgi:hypothetical protein